VLALKQNLKNYKAIYFFRSYLYPKVNKSNSHQIQLYLLSLYQKYPFFQTQVTFNALIQLAFIFLLPRIRDVNLHPSERIPREDCPVRSSRNKDFFPVGMEAKIPPRAVRGGEQGSCIRPRGFPESVYI
jgi:hypothetical protein